MHSWVAADALAEQTPMAAHGMLTTFQSLCAAGCEYGEIKDYVRRAAEAYESPAGPAMLLQGMAHATLSGCPARDARDLLREADETTPADVGRAAPALYDQMLVAASGVLPAVQGRMGMVPAWSSRMVTGKRHKSADSDAILTTGDEGVMLTGGPGKHVTVRYDSVAALLRWNDGRQALALRILYAVLILVGIAGAVAGFPQGIFLSVACGAALVRMEMQYGRLRR